MDAKLQRDLPPIVETALKDLPAEQQASFAAQYVSRKKSLGMALLLVLVLPGFHFYQLGFTFGRFVLSVLFQTTLGGLFIWWLLEVVLHPKRVRRHNQSLATEILKDVKVLNS